MNQLLDTTPLKLRLADSGTDIGRMVESPHPQLAHLSTEMLSTRSPDHSEIAHAIANFRNRHATVEAKRSAVRDLAMILESHRKTVIANHLARKDENALFQIANQFHIRLKTLISAPITAPDSLNGYFTGTWPQSDYANN